ncbi:hypothetical protein PC9H_006877 [Pleurotus ostreatus]|uniref:Uncharacterized protein n=1 Tax=Pleurotus ostreatus TaxID=5322 RepID=A0A8H6ZYR3_PLEOS|nr:uncharacterized protein PC9H_006877 [Pleurotus ostreatus]KAF7431157.1 hypothetical protein PC9H_006877 [Pleurotus ostreatus]
MSDPSNSTYFRPVGETNDEIFLEKTFLASGYLTGLGFGVQLTLYGACVRILLQRKKRAPFIYFLIGYITVLCAMNTIWTGTSAYGLQLTFIENRNYPGGPLGFLLVEFSLPVNVLALASYIIGNILADTLLLWRCRIIWTASLGKKIDFVMIFPTLMLVASIVMAIIYTVDTASPTIGFFSKSTVNFGTVFLAISLSLNIVLTLMIVVRIWGYQRQGRSVFGKSFGQHYTSISTVFVESAAMYTIVSILLLATYSIGHPINQIFLGVSPSVQMVANYLIIYRVAQGRAWTSDTLLAKGGNTSAPIAFASATGGSIPHLDGSGRETTVDIPLSHLKERYKGSQGSKSTTATVAHSIETDAEMGTVWATKTNG